MKLRAFALAAVLVATTTLTGCLESADVTLFTPGVYKGADDPLIDGGDEAALRARFAGQTDR